MKTQKGNEFHNFSAEKTQTQKNTLKPPDSDSGSSSEDYEDLDREAKIAIKIKDRLAEKLLGTNKSKLNCVLEAMDPAYDDYAHEGLADNFESSPWVAPSIERVISIC